MKSGADGPENTAADTLAAERVALRALVPVPAGAGTNPGAPVRNTEYRYGIRNTGTEYGIPVRNTEYRYGIPFFLCCCYDSGVRRG